MEHLSSLFNLVLIIVGFGFLIFVHELGHFVAAKWADIRTEAFAIGMGPVLASWRKGVGFAIGSTSGKVQQKTGKKPEDLSNEELTRHGIGETEYSLRWVPIGGFVKMLGQEDAKPGAISDDPRSYNMRPIAKRMIVVSAGVIMNVLTALVMFVFAFQVGVRFEAPVVGEASADMAAGTTMPLNAESLGITARGLLPGDRVTRINGDQAHTFADLQIASAMSKANVPLDLNVERKGYDQPLEFELMPTIDSNTGLLGVGLAPASSNTLLAKDDSAGTLRALLDRIGLTEAGVGLGMRLVEADGTPIHGTFQEFDRLVGESEGQPVPSLWQVLGKHGDPVGDPIAADIPVAPEYQLLLYPQLAADGRREFEFGLLGLTPMIEVTSLGEGSRNADVLQAGDVILRVGSVHGPRIVDLQTEVGRHARGTVELMLLRDGKEVAVSADVNRKGQLGITTSYMWEMPYIAQPFASIARPTEDGRSAEAGVSPVATLELAPRTRIDAVNGTPVADWAGFRRALLLHTAEAASQNTDAEIALTVTHPTPGNPQETLSMTVAAGDVADLHALSWRSELPGAAFQPVYTTLSSEGNPFTAIGMGLSETYKFIVLTYMTIDRVARGTVGVEQLRGPVGIVHIGMKVVERGFTYLIFLLAMISVNLAVINFLPLPIVDGGLFLFLVYEKLKGRPPSLAFQNVATVVGLCIIGGLLLLVTYNDIVRLFA